MGSKVRSASNLVASPILRARFSLHFCRAILREAGSQMVAKDAAQELSKSLEKIAFEIAKIAVLCADDEARLKVTDEDVRSALKEYFER